MCIQTTYCLLIQPNPDSALNASAGRLLQDDYDLFARQARLMTSIHGSVPPDLKDMVLSARRRGEIAGTAIGADTNQNQTLKGKSGGSFTRPPTRKPPDCVTRAQSALSTLDQLLENGDPERTSVVHVRRKRMIPRYHHPQFRYQAHDEHILPSGHFPIFTLSSQITT